MISKTRSEVKITVTPKWYTTLRHPKMHPHTKFGVPTSKNIEIKHQGLKTKTGFKIRKNVRKEAYNKYIIVDEAIPLDYFKNEVRGQV